MTNPPSPNEALREALKKIDKALWNVSGKRPKRDPQAFVDLADEIEDIVTKALSPLSGEPASDACTVCGIANRNHHTHLAPFNENFHPFGEPASAHVDLDPFDPNIPDSAWAEPASVAPTLVGRRTVCPDCGKAGLFMCEHVADDPCDVVQPTPASVAWTDQRIIDETPWASPSGQGQIMRFMRQIGMIGPLSKPTPVEAKPWYETDAHRDLSRIIPDMEGKIADAKTRYAHCLPDHLFAPLEASITELRVLRHEVAAQPTPVEAGLREVLEKVKLAIEQATDMFEPLDGHNRECSCDSCVAYYGLVDAAKAARAALSENPPPPSQE